MYKASVVKIICKSGNLLHHHLTMHQQVLYSSLFVDTVQCMSDEKIIITEYYNTFK